MAKLNRYIQFLCLAFIFVLFSGSAFFQKSGLVIQPTVTASSGGTTVLIATSNQVQVTTGVLSHSYTLPDETLVPIGWFYKIINNSTSSINVNDFNGALVISLAGGSGAVGDSAWITSNSNVGQTGNWVAEKIKSSSSSGVGTVTSVDISAPVDYVVSNHPITTSGTIGLAYRPATANLVFAGPSSGTAQPNFRFLVGADLPNPSAVALGGVQSLTGSANNFLTGISTLGVPQQARPTCANLSDSSASCATDATDAFNITKGVLNAAKLPAFSGAITTATGTSVTTLSASFQAPFSDATALIKNSSDATKLIQWDASPITTATTRQIHATDNDIYLGALDDGYQRYVSIAATLNATGITGTPAAGFFYSDITNRAQIIDPTRDLKPRLGIERMIFQNMYPITGESGPSGQRVFGVANDPYQYVRFVGAPTQLTGATGNAVTLATTTNDYMEVVCNCTGLNLLTLGDNAPRNFQARVDGGTLGANLWPANITNSIDGKNTALYSVINVSTGKVPGVHTWKIVNNSTVWAPVIYGVEFIYENGSSWNAPTGLVYGGLKQYTISATTNNIATSSVTGTTGGRVLVYAAATNSVTNVFQAASASAVYLQFASHVSEEVANIYSAREFGSSDSTKDFDSLTTGGANRSYTLDDNTTTLLTINGLFTINTGLGEGISCGTACTFVFTGTGLDITNVASGSSGATYAVTIDNVIASAASSLSGSGNGQVVPIVSGLPYGSHVVQFDAVGGSGVALLDKFIVYQPKTPTLPAGGVPLAAYNVLATFVANATQSFKAVDTGIIKKNIIRESFGVGSWTLTQTLGSAATDHPAMGYVVNNTSSAQTFWQYSFWGTGFDIRFGGQAAGASITVDGSSVFTGNTWSQYGQVSAFSPAAGTFTLSSTGSESGLIIRGFALGMHTIKVSYVSGTSVAIDSIDIITPIHEFRTLGPTAYSNTSTSSYGSISDLRPVQPVKDRQSQNKSSCYAYGLTSAPTTTATVFIPVDGLTCVVNSTTGKLLISYSADSSNSAAGSANTFQVFIDSVAVGNTKTMNENVLNDQVAVGDTLIVPVAPGRHVVKLHWKVSANTGTLTATDRNLSVMEF